MPSYQSPKRTTDEQLFPYSPSRRGLFRAALIVWADNSEEPCGEERFPCLQFPNPEKSSIYYPLLQTVVKRYKCPLVK